MLEKSKLNVSGQGLRIGLVASRFNGTLVDRLISGAQETLTVQGVLPSEIELFEVPGSFELPLACKLLAQWRRFDALVALGVVLRGETSSYDLICSAMINGINRVSLKFDLPIGLGVITAENEAQAAERAGGGLANRGSEAALAALQMANFGREVKRGTNEL